MNRYSPERKAAILKKLLPPLSLSVMELARQEGISDVTLYTWRKQAKARGEVVSGSRKVPEDWPAEAKLTVVIETATLSEAELSEYCRKKGVYPVLKGSIKGVGVNFNRRKHKIIPQSI